MGVAAVAFIAGATFDGDGDGAGHEPSWVHVESERVGVLGDGGRGVGYVSADAMHAPPVVVDGRVQPGGPLDVYDDDGVRIGVFGASGFVADGSKGAGSDVPTTTVSR